MTVPLTLGFLVHHQGMIGGSCVLRVMVNCHLESARGTLVLLQLKREHVGVFCLDALCNGRSMLVVASAPAELNKYKVTRIWTAAVQNLHFLRLLCSHYLYFELNYYKIIKWRLRKT